MLTQGPTPDPKCKLNIWSFLTLPHFLDCLICTRNSVPIILLLWIMGGWDRWGVVDSYWGLGAGTGGAYYLLFCFFVCLFVFICAFVFWSLVSCLFFNWVEHNRCCVFFFVYYLLSLSLVPLSRSYHPIVTALLYKHHKTSRSSWSFQLADLLTLFIITCYW